MANEGSGIFFVYETEQVPLLAARLRDGLQVSVIALDREVEWDLVKAGIPFSSVQDDAAALEGSRDVIELTRRIAHTWYSAPEMAFFQHEGILLGEQHEGPVLYYLQTLVYFLSAMQKALAHTSSVAKIYVPESFQYIPPPAEPTLAYKARLPADLARLLAEQHGIPCEIIPAPIVRHGELGVCLKTQVYQLGAAIVVAVSNMLVSLQRSRPIKLFVTDSWANIAPYISGMHDVEIVMTRREEIKHMKGALWRTRARFHHKHDFVDARVRRLAKECARSYARAWDALGTPAIAGAFVYEGVSFWHVVEPMLRTLVVDDAPDAVATIENTKQIFRRYRINGVLLFASTKGYNNLIAHVAERGAIPSIELQHALSRTEPSHPYVQLPATYLAAYGALSRRVYERAGLASSRLIEIGSPRFDAYQAPLSPSAREALRPRFASDDGLLNTLMVVPPLYLSLENPHFTSYAVERIMQDYGDLQKKHPVLRCIVRLRPWKVRERFYKRDEMRKHFSDATVISQYENMRALLDLSDLVISINSTVVLEAMLVDKPVIVYAPRAVDRDFDEFADSGAVYLARTPEELAQHLESLLDPAERAALVGRAKVFLQKNFSFDGKSAERTAALIRQVVKPS